MTGVRGPTWVRFFPSDWLAGTRGMTAAETGIYITLVALMYEQGGSVENDPARLARLCGSSPAAFKRALAELIRAEKIVVDGTRLSNDRADRELVYAREKSNVARDKADRRWGGKANKNKGGADAVAMPEQCRGNANQNQNQKDKKEPPLRGPPIAEFDLVPTAVAPDEITVAVDLWNETAAEIGLPQVAKLDADRRKRLRARLHESGGLDGWREALARIRGSPFLRGDNERGWKADFDFVLRPKQFTKLMEGSYAEQRGRQIGGANGPASAAIRAIRSARHAEAGER